MKDACAGGKIMKLREDDIPVVKQESFRCGGPKPQTKESAIASLAHTVEGALDAAWRKLMLAKNRTLVMGLIEERISDPRLEDCDLTLGGIENHCRAFPVYLFLNDAA